MHVLHGGGRRPDRQFTQKAWAELEQQCPGIYALAQGLEVRRKHVGVSEFSPELLQVEPHEDKTYTSMGDSDSGSRWYVLVNDTIELVGARAGVHRRPSRQRPAVGTAHRRGGPRAIQVSHSVRMGPELLQLPTLSAESDGVLQKVGHDEWPRIVQPSPSHDAVGLILGKIFLW